MKRWLGVVFAAMLIVVGTAVVRAQNPAHPVFRPAPPGVVLQMQAVDMGGTAMHALWQAVLSRKVVGVGHGRTFYQEYLSIYAPERAGYRLRYRSPGGKMPFDTVAKVNGVPLWFPVQNAKIVGAGTFMGPGRQQLVVESQQAAADCGTAHVDLFAYDAQRHAIVPVLAVENGCDLQAGIVRTKGGDALRLTGPYYAEGAALCCPTKPKAVALLHFVNATGRWVQSRPYFTILKPPGDALP